MLAFLTKVTSAAAAMLVCLGLSVAPAKAQQRSWSPTETETKNAIKRCQATSATALYICAKREGFEKRKKDLPLAIAALKTAIQRDGTPSPNKKMPNHQLIEYFPYFLLARAYADRNQWHEARECLEKCRQKTNGLEESQEYAGQFEPLKREIDLHLQSKEFLDLAKRVLEWDAARPDSSERDPTLSREIEQARAQFNNDGSEDSLDELRDALRRLCSTELTRFRTSLEELRQQWSDAFRDDVLANCEMPVKGEDAENIADGLKRIETCAQAEDQAVRQAGRWARDELRNEQSGVRPILDDERQWAELRGNSSISVPIPELPDWCAEKAWSGSYETVVSQLKRAETEYETTLQAFRDAKTGLEESIERQKEDLLAEVREKHDRIPEISNRCEIDLRLGQVRQTLNEYRSILDPEKVPDSGLPDASVTDSLNTVDQQLGSFTARVEAGVQRLVMDLDDCPDAKDSAGALQASLQRYGPSPSAQLWSRLCEAARDSNALLGQCWETKCDDVAVQVSVCSWSLREAEGWEQSLQEIPGGLAPAVSCISEVLEAAPQRDSCPQDSASRQTWVLDAMDFIGQTPDCLQAYRASRDHLEAQIRDDLNWMLEELNEIPVDPADSNLDTIRIELAEAKRELAAVAEIPNQAPIEAEALQTAAARFVEGREGSAAAAAASAEERLGSIESIQDEGIRGAGYLGYRDAVVTHVWFEAASKVLRNKPAVEGFGAHRGLETAFETYARGNLDDAIRFLRDFRVEGRFSGRADFDALAHASLSFFLHLKSRFHAEGSPPKEFLQRDAQAEVRAAMLAQTRFELPDFIPWDDKFRHFFRENSGTASPAND